MNWLRLIRWRNLFIIFLTQAVAWWCVSWHIEGSMSDGRLLTPGNFLLLTLSTILIAAAGYIINDYFDIRIDAINKPDAVILEKTIPRRSAIIVHSALNVLALLLAGIVAARAGHPEWLFLQAACIAMLWRYSTTWKRKFVIGNIIVAFLAALTIILLMLYSPELDSYYYEAAFYTDAYGTTVPNPAYVLAAYSLFAFLTTWIREVVKDMEDLKGDTIDGCKTMPVRLGLQRTIWFVQMLAGIACALLVVAATGFAIHFYFSTALLMALLAYRLLRWTLHLPDAATTAHYAAMSKRLKRTMVLGLVALVILSNTVGFTTAWNKPSPDFLKF